MGLWDFIKGAKDVSNIYKNLRFGKFAGDENRRRQEDYDRKNPQSFWSTAIKVASVASWFIGSNKKSQPRRTEINSNDLTEKELAGKDFTEKEKNTLFTLLILLGSFGLSLLLVGIIEAQYRPESVKHRAVEKEVVVENKAAPPPGFMNATEIKVSPATSKPVVSAEDEYLKGCAEYNRQNYAFAYTLFASAARENHKLAQYNLGCMFKNGEGVGQDLDMAIFWFMQSRNNGYAEAAEQINEINRYLEAQKSNSNRRKN